MALTAYTTSVLNLLNDPNNQFYSTTNVTAWINQARQHVAMDSQCIRILPPSSGTVASIAVTAPGTGYTGTPTVTISAPDAIGSTFVQATATAAISGTGIASIAVTNPGTGYVAVPTVTIIGTGTGATATATNSTGYIKLIAGQEVYPFSVWNTVIAATSTGVASLVGIQSIAASWGAMKPVVGWSDWSAFQAYYRSWNIGFQNYPVAWAQFGQGVSGSAYFWPIPSVDTQVDVDCYCLPIPLVNDSTAEAIPYPFTEAVQYYACYMAYLNAQRRDDANFMLSEYKRMLRENRTAVSPAMVPSFYNG